MLKEKLNIFTKLVELVKKDFQSVAIVALAAGLYFSVTNRDADKDRLYGMVIEEVKKQVQPIKKAQDSTKVVAEKRGSQIDTAVNAVMNLVDKAEKKLK